MSNSETSNITTAGEGHVEKWLSGNGYNSIIKDIAGPGPEAIEANGTIENILVIVKTAVTPNQPVEITRAQKNAIKTRAEQSDRKAYVAYVIIDANKDIVGEIIWERIG